MGTEFSGRAGQSSGNVWFLLLLFFVLPAALGAGSLKGAKEEMEITGKIAVIGNEPFAQLAVRSDDGQTYVLLGERSAELRRLQGRRVVVAGKPSEEKPRGIRAVEVISFRVLEEK